MVMNGIARRERSDARLSRAEAPNIRHLLGIRRRMCQHMTHMLSEERHV